MSALGALLVRDGSHAEPSDLTHMLAAAPHLGSRVQLAVDRAAVLGVQHVSTVHASARVERVGELTIAFVGRVHNLAEVWAELATAGRRGPEPVGPPAAPEGLSAAGVVLRAFDHWRERCAERLNGEFTFVVWDAVRRRLYCARDAVGVQPLYYHASPRRLAVATEIGQVLAAAGSQAPCESFVAEMLAFDVRSRSDTLYRDIHRLPGGHWMTATDRELRVVRYWAPDGAREVRCAGDDEYAGRVRAALRDAVGDRAPRDTAVAAYLSGGLDSSSVVGTARALDRPLETFSLVFPELPEADERPFIDAVVARHGLQAHRLAVTRLDPEPYRSAAGAWADLPDLPSDALGEPLLAAMRARGFTAALTGAGGDYGFTGSFRHYAELLQQRDVRGLVRQIRADRAEPDLGWSPMDVFTSGIRFVLPAGLRRLLRPVGRGFGLGVRVPAWVDPAFAARTALLDRLSAPRTARPAPSPARAHVCELFESGWTARILESSHRTAARHGIELRHPFFDRRLVDLSVALPESQRWRGTTTKFVLRQAMRDVLPESVYARTGKGDFTAFVPQAVDALGGESRLRRLQLEALGWVRSAPLLDELRRSRELQARGDPRYGEGALAVWMVLAVETWYRAHFGEGTTHGRVTQNRPAGARVGPDRPADAQAVHAARAR